MTLWRSIAMGSLALLAAACGNPAPAEDGRDDAFLGDHKFDTGGIAEGTVEARGILALVNAAGHDLLVEEVGLAERAAANILDVRLGDDGLTGTADDVAFSSLAQLDAVPFIGPKVFGALVSYARSHGFIPTGDGGPADVDAGVGTACGAFVDTDGDGVNEQRWAYDLTGLPSLETDSLFALKDGALVEKDVYKYDGTGQLLEWSSDTTADPTAKLVQTSVYDAEGRLLEQTSRDGGGVAQSRLKNFTFEANKQPLVQENEILTEPKRTDRITYTRDARGRVLTKDVDKKADGTPDTHQECIYDHDAVFQTCTTTNAGHPDQVTLVETRTRRPDGALLSYVRVNGAGALVYKYSYTYDAQGRWLTYVFEQGDTREVTTARYDCR